MDKQVNLVELFPRELIDKAMSVDLGLGTKTHKKFETLVEPYMERIDKATSQKNDLGYMAYALEYLVTTLKDQDKGPL